MKEGQRIYTVSKVKFFAPLLKRKVPALLVHWVFQGILYMDATERIFKLSIDLILSVIFSILLNMWFSIYLAIAVSLIFSHTLNFLINAQIYVVLKHFTYVERSKKYIKQYTDLLKIRIIGEHSIRCAAAFGSLSRNELKATSDLDIRLVRYPGLVNGIRACWFVLKERSRALGKRFALDIYVLDNLQGLNKLRSDEPPVVLYDPSGELEGMKILNA